MQNSSHEVLQRGHTYPYFKQAKPEAGREVISEVFPFYSEVTNLVAMPVWMQEYRFPSIILQNCTQMATDHNNETKCSAPNACFCGINIPHPIPGSHAF